MWRRVSCEQPLNTSQSILRLRGSLVQCCREVLATDCTLSRKGMRSIFLNLIAETFGPSYLTR